MRLVDTEISECACDDNHIVIGKGIPLFLVKMSSHVFSQCLQSKNCGVGEWEIIITVKDKIPYHNYIIDTLKDLRNLPEDYDMKLSETKPQLNFGWAMELINMQSDWIFKFVSVISVLQAYLKTHSDVHKNKSIVRSIVVYDYETGREFSYL